MTRSSSIAIPPLPTNIQALQLRGKHSIKQQAQVPWTTSSLPSPLPHTAPPHFPPSSAPTALGPCRRLSATSSRASRSGGFTPSSGRPPLMTTAAAFWLERRLLPGGQGRVIEAGGRARPSYHRRRVVLRGVTRPVLGPRRWSRRSGVQLGGGGLGDRSARATDGWVREGEGRGAAWCANHGLHSQLSRRATARLLIPHLRELEPHPAGHVPPPTQNASISSTQHNFTLWLERALSLPVDVEGDVVLIPTPGEAANHPQLCRCRKKEAAAHSSNSADSDRQSGFEPVKETREKKRGRKPIHKLEQQALNHVEAERQRREKFNKRFYALWSMVPNVSRMDKASLLSDAVAYIKGLKGRVEEREGELRSGSKKKETATVHEAEEEERSAREVVGDKMEVEVRIMGEDAVVRVGSRRVEHPVAMVMEVLREMELPVRHASVSCVKDIVVQDIVVKVPLERGGRLVKEEGLRSTLCTKLRVFS